MSVVVYAETSEGNFKNNALEVVSYGKKVAEQMNLPLIALTVNATNPIELAKYGADKIVKINHADLNSFNAKIFAGIIQQVAERKRNCCCR